MVNRLNRVKAQMELMDISALLVTKKENQIYLSGFHSSSCEMIITRDKNYLLTDFRYIEAASEKSPLYEAVLTDSSYTLHEFLKESDIKKLAVEEKCITVSAYNELKNNTDCELISGDGIVEDVRIVKDDSELESIAKAEALGDLCFSHILSYLKPGLTEIEVATEIELFLRKNGAERLSFDTICVSGERTSLPHGEPSNKKLKKGEFVTLDFGCVVDGYCSDMTRTVALGSVTQEQRDIYNLVLQAQKAGCDEIKSGVSCFAADKTVRDIIAAAGFGSEFGHGTGHGVGLEIHEAPTLNPRSKEILRENMVVTIEPGIYIPKKFGVRIEDLAIVTDSGIINTVKSDKELIII